MSISCHQESLKALRTSIQDELVSTVGCTDPNAITLSAAHAAHLLFSHDEKKDITDSGNYKGDHEAIINSIATVDVTIDAKLFKNALQARIPNTGGLYGIELATVLGILLHTSNAGLQIFDTVEPAMVLLIQQSTILPLVQVHIKKQTSARENADSGVYCETHITLHDGHSAVACIQGRHDRLVWREFDTKRLVETLDSPFILSEKNTHDVLSLESLITLVPLLKECEIPEIGRAFSINQTVFDYGEYEEDSYALSYLFHSQKDSSLPALARKSVAMATYRRMIGKRVEVVSCGGSGNHGLTFFLTLQHGWQLPFIQKERSLFHGAALGLALIIGMKEKTGILTNLCGCALTSALAVAAALVWGMGGAIPVIIRAMNIVLLSLGGIICDGAKPSCAYKTGIGAQIAIEAAIMAHSAVGIESKEGLAVSSYEELLEMLHALHSKGMSSLEETLGSLLLNKQH